MKISVDFDLGEFRELWGDDLLSTCIADEVKREVLKRVKASPEYKAIVEDRETVMMDSLHKL